MAPWAAESRGGVGASQALGSGPTASMAFCVPALQWPCSANQRSKAEKQVPKHSCWAGLKPAPSPPQHGCSTCEEPRSWGTLLEPTAPFTHPSLLKDWHQQWFCSRLCLGQTGVPHSRYCAGDTEACSKSRWDSAAWHGGERTGGRVLLQKVSARGV